MARRILVVVALGMGLVLGAGLREAPGQIKFNKQGQPIVRGANRVRIPGGRRVNMAFRAMLQARNAQFKAAQEQWAAQQEAERLEAERKLQKRMVAAEHARKFKEEQRERIKARMAREKEEATP